MTTERERWPGARYPAYMRRLLRKQRAEQEQQDAKHYAARERLSRQHVAQRGRAMEKRA